LSRTLSLIVLAATVVAIGLLFFQVVQPFIFPIFFAGVLAVLFHPLFVWTRDKWVGHNHLAAALVTVGVLAVVLLPLGAVLSLAGVQLLKAGQEVVSKVELPEDGDSAEQLIDSARTPQLARWVRSIETRLTDDTVKQLRQVASSALLGVTETLYTRTTALASDLIAFIVGLSVTILALHYFLADGEAIMLEVHRLSPLEEAEEHELFSQFQRVCRGVVLATVVAAVIQGVLGMIGYALVGLERIWLLTVLTMFSSFIPFLGAAAVWACVAVGLLVEQRYFAALFLAIYGLSVVSTADNLIRAYVIHGRVQMHPLVALVTVLGALQLVGLWGIFLGPITGAFFYALLNILHNRLVDSGDDDPEPGDTPQELEVEAASG